MKKIAAFLFILTFAALIHLSLQISYAEIASLYTKELNWTNNTLLFLFDRFLYAALFNVAAYFFLFPLFQFFLNQKNSSKKKWTLQLYLTLPSGEKRDLKTAIFAGSFLGIVLFFSLLLFTNLSSGEKEPISFHYNDGKLQNEIRNRSNAPALFVGVSGVITPILEEIYYRGLLLSFLQGATAPYIAIFIQAAFFAISHPPAIFGFMFYVGSILGILCWRYGVVSSILAHTIYNSLILLNHFF